jgi:hypothetical protein
MIAAISSSWDRNLFRAPARWHGPIVAIIYIITIISMSDLFRGVLLIRELPEDTFLGDADPAFRASP